MDSSNWKVPCGQICRVLDAKLRVEQNPYKKTALVSGAFIELCGRVKHLQQKQSRSKLLKIELNSQLEALRARNYKLGQMLRVYESVSVCSLEQVVLAEISEQSAQLLQQQQQKLDCQQKQVCKKLNVFVQEMQNKQYIRLCNSIENLMVKYQNLKRQKIAILKKSAMMACSIQQVQQEKQKQERQEREQRQERQQGQQMMVIQE